MSARPQRDRRRPGYLSDYVCDGDTGDAVGPQVNARQVLERRADSLSTKVTRNIEKAVYLIENWGSRTLLLAIRDRIDATFQELETVCQDISMMGDAANLEMTQSWLDDCQVQREDIMDNIMQHLDVRDGEPASENRSSLHTEKLSGINVWRWLKDSCGNPQAIPEENQRDMVRDLDDADGEKNPEVKVEQQPTRSPENLPDQPEASQVNSDVDVVHHPEIDVKNEDGGKLIVDNTITKVQKADTKAEGAKPEVKIDTKGAKPKVKVDPEMSKVDAVSHPQNDVDADDDHQDVETTSLRLRGKSSDHADRHARVSVELENVARPPLMSSDFKLPPFPNLPRSMTIKPEVKFPMSRRTQNVPTTRFDVRSRDAPTNTVDVRSRDVPTNTADVRSRDVTTHMVDIRQRNVPTPIRRSMPVFQPETREPRNVRDLFQGIAKPRLKQFQGTPHENYFDWREQFDLFIDQTPVPFQHKMVMLKSSLSGKPLQLIDKYGYTQVHYEAALDKLEERYGGKRRLIQRHMKQLMSQPRVSEDDLKGLERFADNLEDAVLGMRQHGGESALLGDSAILSIVIQKTPEMLFLKYQDSYPTHENLITFSTWLSTYVSRRLELKEMRDGGKGNNPSNNPPGPNKRGGRYNQNSTSFATQSKSKKKNTGASSELKLSTDEKCVLCEKQHAIKDCSIWRHSDVHKRWDMAKENRLCYRCLFSSHRAKFCDVNKLCQIEGCTRKHHHDLHYNPKKKDAAQSDVTQTVTNAFGVTNTGGVQITKVALRVLPVRIFSPDGRSVVVNAFLDDGSDSSFIRQDIVEDLGLSTQSTRLTLSTLVDTQVIDSGLVSFEVESLDGKTRKKIGARTMVEMCSGMYVPNWCKRKSKWGHLADIPFDRSRGRRTVDVIIGSDHPELTLSLEERIGKPGEPIARKTPLGWTCSGVVEQGCPKTELRSHYGEVKDESLDEKFKALWNMDIIEPDSDEILTRDEQDAMKQAIDSRVKIDGRYQIAIPWKEGCPKLPDNHPMAEKRLRNLEAHLSKNTDIAEKYKEAFQAIVDKGYVQKVEVTPQDTGWYLPHFAVVKEDRETSKVRIVYDAAATYEGTSINEQMLPGPNLQKDILEILIRFRRKPVALGGDIKEMFNQVMLDPKERKYHRLLWRDLDREKPVEVYEAVRLVFGDRASPFLAQFILQQQARESQAVHPEAADALLKCTYMDDVLDSIETVTEAKKIRKDLQVVGKSAGYEIRKWCSNRVEVLNEVPVEDRATGVIIGDADLPNVKTLGVWWDANDDAFTFTVKWTNEEIKSKRQLLSKIATTFDPFQFLAPLLIRGRIALQSAWLAGMGWDDELPVEIQRSVNSWIEEMAKVKDLRIARCYRQKPIEEVKDTEIHTFCDASKEAYAAVTFIRFIYRDGSVEVSFVGAKARVTPLRAISIPRLELMAAVLGVRLSKIVGKVLLLPVAQHTFWTDSTDVLFWVRNQSRRFKPFVANRVSQIHESTSPHQWRHVPGKLNPADDATRGLNVTQMDKSSRWCGGPEFLKLSRDQWPVLEWYRVQESQDALSERPKTGVAHDACRCASTYTQRSSVSLIQLDRYSKWLRLVRVWAWVFKLCRGKIPGETLTVDDILCSEIRILHQLQQESFPEVFVGLQAGEKPTKKSPLRDLKPFIGSDGLLRAGGRLERSELPYDAKFPILLPKVHHVTTLIIRHYHDLGDHVRGVNGILSDTRSRFWIIHGRELIKTYEKKCVDCQKEKRKIRNQLMAPLPAQRVMSIRAFNSCGVDYGGPYIVKITRNTSDKRYLCLFTCNASRAVHLEVAYSLDTAGFLMAFSRMVARRGRPEEIVSDNGTNFIGAERELAELVQAMDQTKITEKLSSLRIRWKFNPPLASHHGGVFESLIKSAKRALRSILSKDKLRDEELQTAVVEVEGLLNSRPLSYCSSDVKDEPVLTPNHFLHGQAGGQLAPQVVDEVSFHPRNRWRYVQDLVRQAWHRWQREYLHSLQQRPKWFQQSTNLQKDDVVMMVDQQNPRGQWPLARVLEAFPGKDGLVRSVRVLCRGSEYLRPITKLCPLELE